MIMSTSVAVAGDIILLLLGYSLYPRTHFRIDQTTRDEITITVMNTLSSAQEAEIRAELATIEGVAIH